MNTKSKEMRIISMACILLLVSCIIIPQPIYAASGFDEYNYAEAGLPGEYFSNSATSARAFGMGKAYTALADDASGPYWNPSGLTRIKANELTLLSTKLYLGTNYNYAGFAMSVSSKTFYGVSWLGLQIDGIREIDDSGDYKGVFSDSHNAFYITYAKKLSSSLSMGWNMKALVHTMMNSGTTAFGLDFGLMFHPGDAFALGVNFQNIPPFQPKLRLGSQDGDPEDKFPINIKTGMAFKLGKIGKLGRKPLIIAADLDILNLVPDKDFYTGGVTAGKGLKLRWHAGMELNFMKNLSLRAGLDTKDISFGMGMNTRKLGIDYAAVFHYLGLTHRFSVNIKFGVAPSEEERFFAEKVGKMDDMKKALEKEKEELDKFRNNLMKREQIVEEIMLSTKKVEEGRYRAHSLEKIYKKALEWFDEGSYDQSKVKAKEVLELDENDEGAQALLNLIQAHKYLEMSKYNKALKEVLLAMEADPDNERARKMLKKMKELILLMDLE